MKELWFVGGFLATLVAVLVTEEKINKNKSKSNG